MSFILSPSQFFMPELPTWMPYVSGSSDLQKMWVGTGTDAGRVVLYAGGQWRMVVPGSNSGGIFPSMVIEGYTLFPAMRECSGYIYFANSNNQRFVWYVAGLGWIYMRANGAPGYVPDSYTDSDGTVRGDAYWKISVTGNAYSGEGSITLTPQGTASDELTGTFRWDRWDKASGTSVFGEYTAVSSSSSISGTKVFGLPLWKDGSGNTYLRSLAKSGSYYTYGSIHYANRKWIIGTEDSIEGWWEGSEPSTTASVVFKFCVPEGSEVTGEDITITFDSYVEGNNVADVYIGEVAVWR